MNALNNHPLIRKYIDLNQFGRLLGMEFTIIEPGRIEYNMPVTDDLLATPNAAHGGSLAALLDATVGVGALSAVCSDNMVVSTIEMKTTFFGPAMKGDELVAHSFLMRNGKRIIFMEATVHNQRNELVAKASATLNTYPMEKAGYGA
ncbi:MAG: PaaI family thioesterase [Flavobacteriia bacterium]|jgi:uncharacterized protein (TIGR00369 family)